VNKQEEREPEARNEFLWEIHAPRYTHCTSVFVNRHKGRNRRRAGRQEKRDAVLCVFSPLCIVRDQRGGVALTASSADGNSPVSIAHKQKISKWIGKSQLRDSGATIALLSEKTQASLGSELKLPKGRSPRLSFLGAHLAA
jgi:hypothetical protein